MTRTPLLKVQYTPMSSFLTVGLTVSALAKLSFAQSSWQTQAQILDPTQQCTPYGYAPVTAILPAYPPVWTTASLQHAGASAAAKQLYASIQPGIPNISPRGTPDGDWTGVNYNLADDPDCWWSSGSQCVKPKLAGLPEDIVRCEEEKTLGITLDDGPNCSHNALYDVLRDTQQKVTLFYVGSNILNWPLQAQRGLADGHEICAHSYNHQYLTALSNEQVFAELYYSKKAIKDVLGVTVQCFRPPYGDTDDRVRYITSALGMRTVIWTYDTDDWRVGTLGEAKIQENYDTLISRANLPGGQISLAHELSNITMELVERNLPRLKAAYTGGMMPIAVCQNNSQPYIENTATYPTYAQWTSGTREVTVPEPSATSDPDQIISFHFKPNRTGTPVGAVGAGQSGPHTGGPDATNPSNPGPRFSVSNSTNAGSSEMSLRADGTIVSVVSAFVLSTVVMMALYN